jgi:hypothetical protein
MPVDPSTRERVKNVLIDQLGDKAGSEEAQLWQDDHSAEPGGGLVRFIQELARRRGLEPSTRQRLRMELVKTMFPEETSGTEEAQKQEETEDSGKEGAQAAPRSPGQQVCAALVVSMLGQPNATDRKQVLDGLVRNAAELAEVPQETVDNFANWNGNGDPPVGETDDALSGIVHAGYLSLCEVYGPAEADRMLRRCIQRVESMAVAVEYPPRQLL